MSNSVDTQGNSLRRDSIAHINGMGGVSWGSLPIGSWLKDEVSFHNTLKHTRNDYQHKKMVQIDSHNVYLPNLEKQYCKDYSCCGLSLPSLHDLLRHYEEAHISMSPNNNHSHSHSLNHSNNNSHNHNNNNHNHNHNHHHSNNNNSHNNNTATAANTTPNPFNQNKLSHLNIIPQDVPNSRIQDSKKPAHLQQNLPQMQMQQQQHQPQHQLQQHHHGQLQLQQQQQQQQQQHLIQATNTIPPIHLNGSLIDAVSTNDVFLGPNKKGYNEMATIVPSSTLHNNTSVYPAMTVAPSQIPQHQQHITHINGHLHHQDHIRNNNNSAAVNNNNNNNGGGDADGDDDDDDEDEDDDDEDDDDEDEDGAGNGYVAKPQEGYIDDPARRLYVMDHEEHKPFKCPVLGCDKTYKNQNGLKYHKLHGHQNQKLHENPDGTFSILDPNSNEPFPDGMGNEKDKPYRCEVCGKRYKNLNGLKYHRGHSTH
ncbi:hypothetical protein Kpol_1002p4 [Vanderwaltozyma polyspora DSM 70294]|uniref:C2H2-type domain-containing protein n=1 Tax=Vanderwaltozyma polyspora (strain ATCC 22028 / DSM 70294 / BCRC 21397 / CBS 2163 / NBRC 10782 / NRRL Y-8283 / UCD 57-17) TaxID=436907 RepID=A7TE37_VANPO|nr:uncharacterized protein Kpol_1002p4 [Vanderwaltozyma polyspora DSM 70294]EDO19359.1 hypothetical protein Kpol_1002p4 [Vanderwaltozyma polyspora DSM 70294]